MEYVQILENLKNEIDLLNTLIELNELDKDKEEETNRKIKNKELCIEKIKKVLSNYNKNDIEVRLYLELLNGNKPCQAVKTIVDENYMMGIKPCTESGVWNYYKNLKKYLKSLDF